MTNPNVLNPGVYRVFHREGNKRVLVATLVAQSLDGVFCATNHGADLDDWTTNPLIQVHVDSARSTSVGDIVEAPGGAWFRVDSIGWSEL